MIEILEENDIDADSILENNLNSLAKKGYRVVSGYGDTYVIMEREFQDHTLHSLEGDPCTGG